MKRFTRQNLWLLWGLLPLIGITGCENTENRNKLIGMWENEPFVFQGRELPAGSIVMIFREDGTSSTNGEEETFRCRGKWLYTTAKHATPGEPRVSRTELIFQGPDRVVAQDEPPNGARVTLRRFQPGDANHPTIEDQLNQRTQATVDAMNAQTQQRSEEMNSSHMGASQEYARQKNEAFQAKLSEQSSTPTSPPGIPGPPMIGPPGGTIVPPGTPETPRPLVMPEMERSLPPGFQSPVSQTELAYDLDALETPSKTAKRTITLDMAKKKLCDIPKNPRIISAEEGNTGQNVWNLQSRTATLASYAPMAPITLDIRGASLESDAKPVRILLGPPDGVAVIAWDPQEDSTWLNLVSLEKKKAVARRLGFAATIHDIAPDGMLLALSASDDDGIDHVLVVLQIGDGSCKTQLVMTPFDDAPDNREAGRTVKIETIRFATRSRLLLGSEQGAIVNLNLADGSLQYGISLSERKGTFELTRDRQTILVPRDTYCMAFKATTGDQRCVVRSARSASGPETIANPGMTGSGMSGAGMGMGMGVGMGTGGVSGMGAGMGVGTGGVSGMGMGMGPPGMAVGGAPIQIPPSVISGQGLPGVSGLSPNGGSMATNSAANPLSERLSLSPDGRWMAFQREGELTIGELATGRSVSRCTVHTNAPVVWVGNSAVFAQELLVDATNGRPLARYDSEFPIYATAGDSLAYVVMNPHYPDLPIPMFCIGKI